MHHAIHHRTPHTHPGVRSTRAAIPHATFPERIDSQDADVRFPPVILPTGCDNNDVLKDFEHRYRAVRGRDVRFDGWFYVAVTSTGIYCRPSCPAATPKRSNVRFYPTAAAAQYAGFRACKRCRPDAVPGSPEWDTRADTVGRAMRLIADGVVDRDGVAGLARRLRYTQRHLHRLLSAQVGAGPLALARARRAHTARLLIETTDLPITEVAFAAGFTSIRQFNDTIRDVFGVTPRELRRTRGVRDETVRGEIPLRLPFRTPFDANGVLRFLGTRAVAGVETFDGERYRRTLRLPHGAGVVALSDGGDHIRCVLRLENVRDLGSAVQRCRSLLDLDADPVAVSDVLGTDPLLGALVRRSPGRRVPGSVDGAELAFRAVLGQQVSVAGARTLARRLVARCGEPLPETLAAQDGEPTHLFPGPPAVAAAALERLGIPRARRETLRTLARALAGGGIVLDPGSEREDVERRLLELRGIGPWTASYVAMRALGDPDAFLASDLGVKKAVVRLGHAGDRRSVASLAERWRPWRAYATQHLWASLRHEKDESQKREVIA
jgi:AraC family transcriptional regulator, regulatory protein of adaptative response / DNA-3-methyladenine glycosylase II